MDMRDISPYSRSSEDFNEEEPQRYERPSPSAAPEDALSRRTSMSSLKRIDSRNEPLLFSSTQRVDDEIDKATEKDSSSDVIPNTWPAFAKEVWAMTRPGFLLDHLDWASFKVISRTWIAIFFSIVLLVTRRSNVWIGPTSFLLLIVAVIEVAGGISYAQAFYTSIVDLIFIMVGFTVPLVAHGISWRIRGYPSAQDIMKQLSDAGVCAIDDVACMMHEAHKGRFLTTKTSVVALFGIMFGIALTGYPGQKSRFLRLPGILAAICTLINGLYLNFTPMFTPWSTGRAVVLPMGLALACRVFLSFVYFPMTSNFKFFSIVHQGMVGTTSILRTNFTDLVASRPSSEEFPEKVSQATSRVNGVLAKFALLELEGLLCRGELAYSRLDPGDLGELRSLTRALVNSLASFQFFFDQIVEKRTMICDHHNHVPPSQSRVEGEKGYPEAANDNMPLKYPQRRNTLSRFDPNKNKSKWFRSQLSHTYAPAGHYEDDRLDAVNEYDWDNMRMEDLDDLYSLIIEHYRPLSLAILELMSAVVSWSAAALDFRVMEMVYTPRRRKHAKLQAENAARLEQAIKKVQDLNEEKDKQFPIWEKAYGAKHISRSTQHYINSLSIDAFHGCKVKHLAVSAMMLGNYCVSIDHLRPLPTLIYPFMRIRSKTPRLESEYHSSGMMAADMADHEYMPYEQEEHVQRRNPDSTPPRNYFHLLGQQIIKISKVAGDRQIQFAIKRAVFTIAPSLLYTTRTTILFAYNYRLLWVPMMVALTISFQALDGVYGLLARFCFTFIGCLIGMVVWYIGAGSGRGNPYGIAAALGVVMLFLSYYRHYNTHKVPMGVIILCVTVILVTGTSWCDSQLEPQDVKLGWGFDLAWIRFVCVCVGLVIAFIGTILPKPITAKKNIRVMLGGCIEQLGEVQTNICNFGIQRCRDPNVRISPRQDPNRKRLRQMAVTISAVQQLSSRLKYEPPLAGLWPKHRYALLSKLVRELIDIMSSVHRLLDSVQDTSNIPMIYQRMGWTNADLMGSSYSVLVLSGRALSSGLPLPSVTPGHLSEIYSHTLRSLLEYDTHNEIDGNEEQRLEALIRGRYLSRDGRIALALATSMYMMFKRIDACLRIIKGLVGEIYGVDLEVFNYDPEEGIGLIGKFKEDEQQEPLLNE